MISLNNNSNLVDKQFTLLNKLTLSLNNFINPQDSLIIFHSQIPTMEEDDRVPKRPSTFPIFSKTLALQPMTVVDYANDCRKHFEEFNQAFKRRITIELQYARNLDGVSKILDKYIQPGTQKAISFICSAFKVQNQQRAHQARQLAESLRTQIFEICQQTCKQQTVVVKRVQKDVKKYIKEFESLEDNLQRSLENYQKVSEDMEELIITKNFLKHTSQIPQQKKAKIIAKTIQSIKQKKQYQKLYISANRNYNDFAREYNKCITEDLNQVENQIRQQITLQADCLRKLIVCEVSMFKNIEYDLINISKQMEALDTQKDVEVLVEMNQNNVDSLIIDKDQLKKLTLNAKERRKSLASEISSTISTEEQPLRFLRQKESEVDKGMMAISLKNVEEEVFSGKLANKKNKEFKELIQSRWAQLNPKPQQTQTTSKQPNEPQPNEQKKKSQVKSTQQVQQTETKQEMPKQPTPQQQPSTVRQKFDKYFIGSQLSKQILQSKKQEEKQNAFNEVYQNFIIITRYINELWNGQNLTLLQQKKKQKNQQPETPSTYIKKTLGVNHFYRIVSYSFIENFRTHHQVMIESSERVRQISKFVTALLTKSSKENDIFVLRGMLGLLFTFYWLENNTKKLLYSQTSIYKHSMWKKHDFWVSSIFESTYEEMLTFGPQKGESFQETVLREKNLIFSQLASYCHYMIMLGISSKDVRQIVGRYCRLYEMNDDQNRDLSKMITNTVKQYKDILSTQVKNPTKNDKETQ